MTEKISKKVYVKYLTKVVCVMYNASVNRETLVFFCSKNLILVGKTVERR